MRFVVCGEALIDLMPEESISPEESRWIARSGGGPLNSAVALARLGQESYFLGRLSTDQFGRQLRSHLEAADVRLDLAVATDDPTTLAVVSLDDEGKATYAFHFDKTTNFNWVPEDFPLLSAGDWLHLGSIGAIIDPGARHVLDFVNRTEATISYDINVRPSTLPDRSLYYSRVADLMAAVGRGAGIVKASDEDIAWLVDDDEDVLSYAEAWAAEYGLAMFIVTFGSEGVVAVRPDGRRSRVPGRVVEVVDTVGAGDTFMAGFLSAYAHNPADLEGALERGVAAAALVCTRQGAKPPTALEVDALLA